VPVTGLTSLSVTERRVLEAIACGLGRREAAATLRLSIHTIEHSLTFAKEKLQARTVPEATAIYARLAWMQAEPDPRPQNR